MRPHALTTQMCSALFPAEPLQETAESVVIGGPLEFKIGSGFEFCSHAFPTYYTIEREWLCLAQNRRSADV